MYPFMQTLAGKMTKRSGLIIVRKEPLSTEGTNVPPEISTACTKGIPSEPVRTVNPVQTAGTFVVKKEF